MIRLLLSAGRGPVECRIALSHVLEALRREACAANLGIDIVTGRDRDGLGPASAVAALHGERAAEFAKRWTGTVQWTAESRVRQHHKRKNWFIGVFPLPAREAQAAEVRPIDVRFEAFRAGGPGGQHQNRTESAVRATHVPTGLSVVARDERSQHRNKALALQRLASLIAAQADLAELSDRNSLQARHDALERGRPIRTFYGDDFRAG